MEKEFINGKKILLSSPASERGGVEEFMLLLAIYLKKIGGEVHIALENTQNIESLIDDFLENNIICHTEMSKKSGDQKIDWNQRYKNLYMNIKPDIVHINLPWHENSFGAMKAAHELSLKVFVIFHIVPFQVEITREKQLEFEKFQQNGQHWVTVSYDNRKHLESSFSVFYPEINVIHPGIILEKFRRKTNKPLVKKKLCRELEIPLNSFILITVGGLRWHKGHKYLIPVIPRLIKEFPRIQFVWVGTGELEDQLKKELIRKNLQKKVTFAGYRRDIPALLSIADLYVNTSFLEGCPLIILEAMASGCPIVSTNANGIVEIIKDMEHGRLCNQQDSNLLYQSIKWAITHYPEMEKMANNALNHVAGFSLEKMFNRIIDHYCRIYTNQNNSRTFPIKTIEEIKYCITTNSELSLIFANSSQENYHYVWKNIFNGTIKHIRVLMSEQPFKNYDIIHVPLIPNNIKILPLLLNKTDRTLNSKIIVSVNMSEIELKQLHQSLEFLRKFLSKADLVFSNQSIDFSILNTHITYVPYPLPIHVLNMIHPVTNPCYITILLTEDSISPEYLKSITTLFPEKIKLLNNFGNSLLPYQYEKVYRKLIIDENNYIHFLNHLVESKIILIPQNTKFLFPGIQEAAFFGIPVIGNSAIPIIKLCFPDTAWQLTFKNKIIQIINRLLTDNDFYLSVKKKAQLKAVAFHDNTIKISLCKLLFKN